MKYILFSILFFSFQVIASEQTDFCISTFHPASGKGLFGSGTYKVYCNNWLEYETYRESRKEEDIQAAIKRINSAMRNVRSENGITPYQEIKNININGLVRFYIKESSPFIDKKICIETVVNPGGMAGWINRTLSENGEYLTSEVYCNDGFEKKMTNTSGAAVLTFMKNNYLDISENLGKVLWPGTTRESAKVTINGEVKSGPVKEVFIYIDVSKGQN